MSSAAKPSSQAAFARVLDESRRGLEGRSAGEALLRLLTISGRIPAASAFAGLLPWESAVVHAVLGRDDLAFEIGDAGNWTAHVVVSQSLVGKVSLYRADEEVLPPDEVVGSVEVPPELIERADELAAEEALLERRERDAIDAWLSVLERGGRIDSVVDEVSAQVDHVESVNVYVDRCRFCRSDIGNNILRNGRLASLRGRPVTSWAPEERLFVAGISVLLAAGKPILIEEFNGEQLSGRRLRAWLERRRAVYCARLREPARPDAGDCNLVEIATAVAALRRRLEPAGTIGLRRVNGLTMSKREATLPLTQLDPWPSVLPSPLVRLAAELDLDIDASRAYPATQALARVALREKAADPGSRLVESLIERIVVAAVLSGDADYGMSSGIHDLSELRPTAGGHAQPALALTKASFFCAVLPHPDLVERLERDRLFGILSLVAQRMQFNRWHFVVGNFKPQEIPRKRHWYHPPLMPDLAEWSDLHHPGHTSAAVRYTVRAPGPALWRPPLEVFGNAYRGFFDIRLVRMQGAPFRRRELAIACRHGLLIEALWRTAQEEVAAHGAPSPVVSGFGRDYYEHQEWLGAVLGDHCCVSPARPEPVA